MSADLIALVIIAAGWFLAGGTLKLVAKHCQRGIDQATAMNDESKARMDVVKNDVDALLAQIRAENDRTEAQRVEWLARWAEFCGTHEWTDRAEAARWN